MSNPPFDSNGFVRMDLASVLTSEPEPQKMLIPGFLPEGEVVMLGGEGSVSKTELCLTVSVALAGGVPFLGAEPAEPRHMVYAALEGSPRALANRMRRLVRSLVSIPGPEISQVVAEHLHVVFPSDEPGMGGSHPMARVCAYVEALYEDDVRPCLIVIDTMTYVVVGDEKDTGPAREVLEYANYLTRKTEATLLFIHHTKKGATRAGRMTTDRIREALDALRGSSAFALGARFIIGQYLVARGDPTASQDWNPLEDGQRRGDLIQLFVLKNNEGRVGFELHLERDMDTGALSACNPEESGVSSGNPRPRGEPDTLEQKVLRIYQDGTLSKAEKEGLALPLWPDGTKDRKGALRSARRRLREQGHDV